MSRRFANLARQPVLCGYPTDAPDVELCSYVSFYFSDIIMQAKQGTPRPKAVPPVLGYWHPPVRRLQRASSAICTLQVLAATAPLAVQPVAVTAPPVTSALAPQKKRTSAPRKPSRPASSDVDLKALKAELQQSSAARGTRLRASRPLPRQPKLRSRMAAACAEPPSALQEELARHAASADTLISDMKKTFRSRFDREGTLLQVRARKRHPTTLRSRRPCGDGRLPHVRTRERGRGSNMPCCTWQVTTRYLMVGRCDSRFAGVARFLHDEVAHSLTYRVAPNCIRTRSPGWQVVYAFDHPQHRHVEMHMRCVGMVLTGVQPRADWRLHWQICRHGGGADHARRPLGGRARHRRRCRRRRARVPLPHRQRTPLLCARVQPC